MRQILMVGLISSALVLSACTEATTSGGYTTSAASASFAAGKTAEERELEAQVRDLDQVTKNIVVSNTVQGAVFGALAGCGVGLLLGGGRDDCAKGAVVGGLAGGVAGNQVGQAAAQKKREMVERDKVLANLRGVSTKLDGIEGRLHAVLRSQDAELTSLRRQVKANQISQSAYEKRVQAINANRKAVDSGLAKSQANVAETRQEIRVATQQGQSGLGTIDKAAASTESRLARNRKLLTLIQ